MTDGGSALPSARPGYLGPAARRPARPERRRGPLWPVLTGVAEEPNRQTPGNGYGAGGSPALGHPGRFLNRELSWLDFGARLLDLVDDDRLPLLERIKFLAIFAEGLDDFFQVRVAGLEDQVAAGLRTPSPDGLSPRAQLAAITSRATELTERHSRAFLADVGPALSAAGVVLSDWHALDERDRSHLGELFHQQIFPILTPLAVGQGHPFPYISNLSLNLLVRVVSSATGEERTARVKVPPLLPRLVPLPDGDAVRPRRAGGGRPSRELVPGHAHRGTPGVPGHPQCRSLG